MEKVFDSEDFPARDALAAWAEVTRHAVMPTAFRLVDIDTFDGWFKTMPLGPAQVSAMSYSSFCTLRTPHLIRASDPECLQIALPRSGSHVLEQNRCQVPAGPGQLLVFDSSRPFQGYADGEALLIQLPRALLPLPAHRVERLMTRALPGDEGIGRLLATFLTHLAEGDTGCTPRTPHGSGPSASTWSPSSSPITWTARAMSRPTPGSGPCSCASPRSSSVTWATPRSARTASPRPTTCRSARCTGCSSGTA
ncbi:hypothetical protein ABZ478_14815 [Streptomyces sp. NPDC005706]|uniref:cupin domain-containing protein n=1 Tax=Streptomyces sp. NPDC005706 TaxID=3157169 RepID=UPI0033FDC564